MNMDKTMFYDAKPKIFEYAKQLRNDMTEWEKKVWEFLRKNKIYGYRFRAQHPINIYIVDFYCHPLKLVIEIDGEIHENEDAREYDKGREDELREFGLHIIRFTSDEVLTGFEKVKQNILDIAWHLKNSG